MCNFYISALVGVLNDWGTVKCFIKPRLKVRAGYAERRIRWEIPANCSSKPKSKRQLRSHVFRWRDNFTLNLRGTGCKCVCWTDVIHIRVLWLVVVIMLINLQIPWKAGISWPALCLPGMILFYVITVRSHAADLCVVFIMHTDDQAIETLSHLMFIGPCIIFWIKIDQLDVTCFFISLLIAQHVSNVNTSIFRSLRLICLVISWVVLLWFHVCWCYVVVWLGWCGIRMQASAEQYNPRKNSTNKSQAPEDGCINIRNMLGIK